MRNLVIFYPSFERGGATKILINLIKYFLKKNIKIFLIINRFNYKHRNLKLIKLSSEQSFYKSRFFSGLLGSWKLIETINKLNKSETKILSMQSNFFAVLVSFLKNIKVIVRVSEDPCGATKYADEKIFSYLILLSKLITYNMASFIVVNATKSLKCVKKFLYNKNKVKLLYNPSLNKINKHKTKKNKKILLSVGRLCKQKNQILLIKTFSELYKKNKNYKLIICGDGPDKEKINSLINHYNLEKKIILKKWSTNIKSYYKKSSIFILTSLYEGMPNVLIEALNHNMPCISSNVSGVSDLLLDGRGGIILKNCDSENLLKSINKVTKNYDLYLKKTRFSKIYLNRYKINNASIEYFNLLKNV